MDITVFQKKDIDSTDVVSYLKFMEDEDNDDLISRWGEGIAYKLYKDNQYLNLEGYILYYIFEVVTGNMKMNHFKQLESKVGLKYFSPKENIVANYQTQEGAVLTRYIHMTSTQDMRGYGEKHFEDFITYYIRSLVHSMVKDELEDGGLVSVFTKLDRIEYALQFTYFAVKENMGVVSEERYNLIKEEALDYIKQEVVKVEKGTTDRFIQRGSFIVNTMKKLYEQTERL